MQDYKSSLQSTLNKALTVKTINAKLRNMKIVSNRLGRFLSYSDNTRILFVQNAIENLARAKSIAVSELTAFITLHEITTVTTGVRKRMELQIKENRYAAEIAMRIESTWLSRRVNKSLRLYDETKLDNILGSSRYIYKPKFTAEQFELEDGHKAEYYYDILNKIFSLGAFNFLRNIGGGYDDSSMLQSMKVDNWEMDDDYADFVDPIIDNYPNIITDSTADYSFKNIVELLEQDLEEPIEFNESSFVDIQHDKQESQSFGYDDGGADFSYQKIDKRYSDQDVILPGTVGSFENIACIMDISGSMDIFDYSKVVTGIEEVLKQYNTVDLFTANTHVSQSFKDVDTSNLKQILESMYIGGETNMLNVAKEVMKFGGENNRRYTHIFIFTDGQTSYEDLTVFGEGNVFLYITEQRVSPPSGVAFRLI